jgi:outer membrane protein OmpA-like peptidoglycan-associated protein
VDQLCEALDRRDAAAVAAELSPDVVVRAPRLGGPWYGAVAVLDGLGQVWERCEHSRFVVRETLVGGATTRDTVVLALRSSHAESADWIVGVGTLTVTVVGRLVTGADLDLDVDALRAQWHGSRTQAASVRSELALVGFDPDATVVADVRVMTADTPASRSRLRRAVVSAVVVLVALGAVGAVALSRAGAPSTEVADSATGSATLIPSGSPTDVPSVTPTPTQILGPSAVAQSGGGVRTTLSGTLLFDRDSAVIRPAARSQVDALASTLRSVSSGRLQILGYTDNLGSEASARTLSLARAKAVAALFAADLPGTRILITATGLGSSNPVAPNDSEANRAKNRRVEIVYYPS